ncbi:MAG: hypothetical protein JNM59_11465 [Hyphomonadaceae bacterium]|nr:hypothetical protein [Hyphomonadaceae bacterium]
MTNLAFQVMALGLAAGALGAGVAALLSRSLFATVSYLVVTAAQATSFMVLLESGQGATGVAVAAVVWAPLLLLSGVALSARATKGLHARWAWLGALVAFAATAPVALVVGRRAAMSTTLSGVALGDVGFWLMLLSLVVGAAVLGLLGYGERGVLTAGGRK